MSKRNLKDKKLQKDIAKKSINKLFYLAEQKALSDDLDLANRYVEIARKISMRYQLKMSAEFKRRFCKHCYQYLLPGSNCRIRLHRSRLIIFCNNCKKYTRIPLKNSSN